VNLTYIKKQRGKGKNKKEIATLDISFLSSIASQKTNVKRQIAKVSPSKNNQNEMTITKTCGSYGFVVKLIKDIIHWSSKLFLNNRNSSL
jgi:hypothetical protein